MEKIRIDRYLESFVHILHRYMMHDTKELQERLYISVRNDEYDRKVMHDVALEENTLTTIAKFHRFRHNCST